MIKKEKPLLTSSGKFSKGRSELSWPTYSFNCKVRLTTNVATFYLDAWWEKSPITNKNANTLPRSVSSCHRERRDFNRSKSVESFLFAIWAIWLLASESGPCFQFESGPCFKACLGLDLVPTWLTDIVQKGGAPWVNLVFDCPAGGWPYSCFLYLFVSMLASARKGLVKCQSLRLIARIIPWTFLWWSTFSCLVLTDSEGLVCFSQPINWCVSHTLFWEKTRNTCCRNNSCLNFSLSTTRASKTLEKSSMYLSKFGDLDVFPPPWWTLRTCRYNVVSIHNSYTEKFYPVISKAMSEAGETVFLKAVTEISLIYWNSNFSQRDDTVTEYPLFHVDVQGPVQDYFQSLFEEHTKTPRSKIISLSFCLYWIQRYEVQIPHERFWGKASLRDFSCQPRQEAVDPEWRFWQTLRVQISHCRFGLVFGGWKFLPLFFFGWSVISLSRKEFFWRWKLELVCLSLQFVSSSRFSVLDLGAGPSQHGHSESAEGTVTERTFPDPSHYVLTGIFVAFSWRMSHLWVTRGRGWKGFRLRSSDSLSRPDRSPAYLCNQNNVLFFLSEIFLKKRLLLWWKFCPRCEIWRAGLLWESARAVGRTQVMVWHGYGGRLDLLVMAAETIFDSILWKEGIHTPSIPP